MIAVSNRGRSEGAGEGGTIAREGVDVFRATRKGVVLGVEMAANRLEASLILRGSSGLAVSVLLLVDVEVAGEVVAEAGGIVAELFGGEEPRLASYNPMTRKASLNSDVPLLILACLLSSPLLYPAAVINESGDEAGLGDVVDTRFKGSRDEEVG